MKILDLKCISNEVKPKIVLGRHNKIVCLIDTGADTPVWCADIGSLFEAFPDAKETKLKFILTGFGGEQELSGTSTEQNKKLSVEVTSVYKIPKLYFGNSKKYIECRGMLVAVSNKRGFGADLILPYTIFDKSRLTIDAMMEPRRLEMEIMHEYIGMTYHPVILNPKDPYYNEKMDFYKKFCHLSDDEINGAMIMEHLQALSQIDSSDV